MDLDASTGGATDGIVVDGEGNTIIKNCVLERFKHGIEIVSPSNVIIDNKLLSNSVGIWMGGSTNNNVIRGNVLSNKGTGIEVIHSDENTIVENMLIENDIGISLRQSHDNSIGENNLSGGGIRIRDSNRNDITNNIIRPSSQYGIEIVYSNFNTLKQNWVCNDSYTNIYAYPDMGNNFGDENTCDTTHNWDDEGTNGCKYTCSY